MLAAMDSASLRTPVAAVRTQSLRRVLLTLLAPPLLLLALAGALLVHAQWQERRADADQALVQAADTLALAVERELTVERSALEAFSLSPLIDRRDWTGAYLLASRLADRTPGALVAVTSADGQLVFNSALPLGTPLPNVQALERQNRHIEWHGEQMPLSSQGLTRRAREERVAVYSDLYFGVSIKRPTLAIAVPVVREGAVPFTLTYSFPPDALNALLRAQPEVAGHSALVLDGNGRVIAGTPDASALIGRTAPAPLSGLATPDAPALIGRTAPAPLSELATRSERRVTALPGVQELPYIDARPRVVAAQPVEATRWIVLVAAQPAALYGPMQRTMTAWAAVVLLVLAAAWLLAARLSQKLTQPLRQIADLAAHPDSTQADWPRPPVRELAQLAQSLRDAALAARERNEAVVQRRLAEQGEAQARRMAEELQAREAQLRLALAAGRMGFWQLDLATGRVHGDALFAALWDIDPAAPDHDGLGLFSKIHDDDREAVRQGALVDAVAGSGRYAGEFRLVLGDRLRWIAGFADVLRDEHGRAIALIGVNADITERKQMEQQLRDNSAALEEAGRRKDHFLAMLGHELRNPLSPISMAAESLRLSAHDPQRTLRAAEVISRQVQHMVRLIDDLLDVARITQGKIHLQQVPVDLAAVVRDAVETARPLIDARRHRLDLSVAADPMTVLGDPTRLVQVLVNLLTNAAKYTDEGGRIALAVSRVAVAADPPREQAVIEVRDDGIGLPREMLDTVFEAFTQSAGALGRAQGGLGMGLAVVRRLVQMHGGSVHAGSDGPGHGAVFTVTLPLLAASTRVPAPPPSAAPAPAALRVLVVDDNRDSADSLAQLLGMFGHEVRVAYDAGGALAMAPQFRPQVGILDIGLPDLDGRELARRLRALPEGAAMLLIAATGYGRLDDGGDSAFDHHLVKPVDITQVQALLAPRAMPAAAANEPALAAPGPARAGSQADT